MPNYRGLACSAVLLVVFAKCDDCHCHPPEPQATFLVKDGWVEFALRQAGRPVPNVTIQIMTEEGGKFGEGETGVEGQTAFPLPPGGSFIVEIKADERTADPIRLFRKGASVEPARVLLSYGLRPCCRTIKSRGDVTFGEQSETPAEAIEGPPLWNLLVPVSTGVAIAAVVVFIVWRRYRNGL